MNRLYTVVLAFLCSPFYLCAQEITVPKGSLAEALQYIEESTSWIFNYDPSAVAGIKLSSSKDLNIISKTAAINTLLQETRVDFEIIEGVIIILPAVKRLTKFCGYLSNASTGKPLAFAHVYVDNHFGTWTDDEGFFSFEKEVWKDEKLHTSYLGYKAMIVKAQEFQKDCQQIALEAETLLLSDEIVVRDYILPSITKGSSYIGIKMNLTALHKEMGAIEKDVFKGLQFLPGITSLDESAGNLNIRGAGIDQNLILWEGTPLYGNGHFFGMISSINPFIHKNIEVYKTAYHAAYENRIGGVIDIKLASEIPDKIHGGFGLSMTEAHGDLHIPIIKNKLAVVLAGRSSLIREFDEHPTFNSYANKLFRASAVFEDEAFDDEESEYEFQSIFDDFNAKVLFRPTDKLHFSSSLFQSNNEFFHSYAFVENQIAGFDSLRQFNQLWSNKIQYQWNEKHKSKIHLNQSIYENDYLFTLADLEVDEDFERQHFNLIKDLQIGLNHQVLWKKASIDIGYIFDKKEVTYDISEEAFFEQDINTNSSEINSFHHMYANGSFEWNKWHLQAGIRGSYIEASPSFRLSPRLNLSRSINDNFNLHISAGIFNQYIKQLQTYSQSQLNIENRIWILGMNDIMDARKISAGINYQKNQWIIELEYYLHHSSAVPLLTSGQSSSLDIDENGSSLARGLELLLKKRWKNFNSAMSYHLSYVDNKFPSIDEEFFPANNDQRHNLSWVNYYHLKKWSFGFQYHFRSGLPYSKIGSIQYVEEEEENYYETEVEGFNNLRLKDFHRFDASISYSTPFYKDSYLDFQLLIFNVFDFASTTSQSSILSNIDDSDEEPELLSVEKIQLQRTPQILLRLSF